MFRLIGLEGKVQFGNTGLVPTASSAHVSAARLVALVGPVDADRPAYQWLSESIRTLVTDGRLLHGTRLPSERTLVDALGLSRTTVTRAYAELRERGYATARQGSGTIAVLPGGPAAGGAEPMPVGGLDPAPDGAIDLTCAAPPAVAGLASIFRAATDQLGRYAGGMGYYPLGIPEVRAAVAARYEQRGVPTSPEQIILTTGSLESTATAARMLLGRMSRVIVETPTYPNSLATLRRDAGRVVPVPITWAGSDLDAWEAALARSGARFAFLVPDFHNPTGSLLDGGQRERMAALWRRHDVIGIVDETMAELVLDDIATPPPMAAFAKDAITVGSMSKTAWGGLRIGWLRAPRHLIGALARARMSLALGAPVLEQLVTAELLRDGNGLDPERRIALRQQRTELIDGLGRSLPEWQTSVPAGGLSIWWRLPLARSSAFARAAADERVLLAPGSTFAVDGAGLEPWVRTPFALPAEVLADAVPRLARAWSRVA